MAKPITYTELASLTSLGIQANAIGFATLTMESDKWICVRETVNGKPQVVILELSNVKNPKRWPITADSAIMHPKDQIIALKADKTLQIFNLVQKVKLKTTSMSDNVVFWKWVDETLLALVTETSVYHWSIGDDSAPVKVFDRHSNLNGMQIINYRTDAAKKWLLLTGIKSENQRVVGGMQLYSVERKVSQPIEGHAAGFGQLRCEGNKADSNLFAFAVRNAQGAGKLHIVELGSPAAGNNAFAKKAIDIGFSPEFPQDFPVTMQVSEKHKVIFMITQKGFLYIFDLESGTLIYTNRITAETMFTTCYHHESGGILGINKSGQLLQVALDESTAVSYIQQTLGKYLK